MKRIWKIAAIITVGAFVALAVMIRRNESRRWHQNLDDEWQRFSDLIIPR